MFSRNSYCYFCAAIMLNLFLKKEKEKSALDGEYKHV